MKIYHCTTEKKAKQYQLSGRINSPVRGFNTLQAAMYWCMRTNRTVIYEVECDSTLTYKLPDHHNEWGLAFWTEDDITLDKIKCVCSATGQQSRAIAQ